MSLPSFPNSRDAVNAAAVILLVDDNTEFLEVLERRFKRRGFNVVACANAATALEAAAIRNLDVAIIDRGLQGGDGIELLKQLKRDNPELAVIILSGNSDKGTMLRALDSGACEYLAKPCSLVDLEAAARSPRRTKPMRIRTVRANLHFPRMARQWKQSDAPA
jgi:two-component system response regulator RegA